LESESGVIEHGHEAHETKPHKSVGESSIEKMIGGISEVSSGCEHTKQTEPCQHKHAENDKWITS